MCPVPPSSYIKLHRNEKLTILCKDYVYILHKWYMSDWGPFRWVRRQICHVRHSAIAFHVHFFLYLVLHFIERYTLCRLKKKSNKNREEEWMVKIPIGLLLLYCLTVRRCCWFLFAKHQILRLLCEFVSFVILLLLWLLCSICWRIKYTRIFFCYELRMQFDFCQSVFLFFISFHQFILSKFLFSFYCILNNNDIRWRRRRHRHRPRCLLWNVCVCVRCASNRLLFCSIVTLSSAFVCTVCARARVLTLSLRSQASQSIYIQCSVKLW